MPLFNQFWSYSDSWHVAINSDVKYTIHVIGMHYMGLHNMYVHDVDVPGMGVHTKHDIFSAVKTNICCPFKKKSAKFSYYAYSISLNNFLQIKRWSQIKNIKATLPTHP
jgi:hypothetical protein